MDSYQPSGFLDVADTAPCTVTLSPMPIAKLHLPASSAVRWACEWVLAISTRVEVLLALQAWLHDLPLIACSFLSVPLAERCSPGNMVDQLRIADGTAPNRRRLGF